MIEDRSSCVPTVVSKPRLAESRTILLFFYSLELALIPDQFEERF